MKWLRIIQIGFIFTIFQSDILLGQIVNIGIVNEAWRGILEPRLMERQWNDKCKLFEIGIPSNIPFYESIMKAHDIMTTNKLDIIIGDSRLDVAQASATLSIPFIAFDSRLHISSELEHANMTNFYSLPVSDEKYALATFDILKYYRINNVAIIVDETVDYQKFVQMFFEKKSIYSKVWTISSRTSIEPSRTELEVSKILKEIRANDILDIIVKTNKLNLNIIIARAKFYGMISIPVRWYITNIVCENFQINELKHIFTNFTFINEECSERIVADKSQSEQISLVNQFLQIVRRVNWDFSAQSLTKQLKNNPKFVFSFDELGNRNQFTFTFHTLARQSNKILSMIGSWQKTIGKPRIFHMKINDKSVHYVDSGFPTLLRIVAVEEHPHFIIRVNDTSVGFGVDLTQKLANILNFNFTINVTSEYGVKVNDKWDGMMGELVEGRSDISLGPIVQTLEREKILDFSTAFKQREISLVMKKPTASAPYFQFLRPFSFKIWLCVLTSMALLTLILIYIERFHDKYFPEEDRIKFNLKESLWFIFASTLQGGTEDMPYSIPGRILSSTLYFFVLIIVTSYTANLAAFLTLKTDPNPIQSIDDLVDLPADSKIFFGTVSGSAIHEFFKHSEIPSYQKIYNIMTTINNEWLVNSTATGYKRAMKENYVFIWDDSVNQYEISTEKEYDCKLYIVGRPFGKRSFAISMRQGSYYREKINTALLHLLESGTIENLEHKWWKSTSICPGDVPSSEISSGALSVEEVAGVFLVLLCGSIFAVICLIIKILFYRRQSRKNIRTCCSQFFANLPTDSEQPITPKPTRTLSYRSKPSTITSSMRNDNMPSPSSYELQRFFPPNEMLDTIEDIVDIDQLRH